MVHHFNNYFFMKLFIKIDYFIKRSTQIYKRKKTRKVQWNDERQNWR